MGEGKRLYAAYNCTAAMASTAAAAIGPPLMDDKWIYGAGADQIYATISQGRPTACRRSAGTSPTQQIWQLVAYVQSMSRPGAARRGARPQRRSDGGAAGIAAVERRRRVQTGHR